MAGPNNERQIAEALVNTLRNHPFSHDREFDKLVMMLGEFLRKEPGFGVGLISLMQKGGSSIDLIQQLGVGDQIAATMMAATIVQLIRDRDGAIARIAELEEQIVELRASVGPVDLGSGS